MLVRIGLKNSVDWSKFGMGVVADFPDGQAAWDYYEREMPDLVITDIRMPKMDGMKLISNIREVDKASRIVVLTCLEEFELARKAMSYGVSSYILKLTMTEDEIEQVLGSVRDELDRMESKTSSRPSDAVRLDNMDLIKEKMFKDFLFYNIFSPEEFGQFAERNGLRLTPVRLTVCVMEVDRYARLRAKFRDNHGHLIKMTMLNILGEITASYKRGEAFQIDETHYALIFHYDDILSEQAIVQETRVILGRIQEVIRTYFNGSASFGISGIRSGYDALPMLYAEARQALEHKFIVGPGQHHRKSQQQLDTSGVRSGIEAIRRFPAMFELLSAHKRKEYEGFLDHIENGLHGDRKSLEAMLFRFVQWIGNQLIDDYDVEKPLTVQATAKLAECDSLPDMLDEVTAYLAEITEQARERLQLSDEISKAIRYIHQHYTENISLQAVADHVGLSVSYLSNLFKRELQISFVDYLNRYRIDRAKELLTDTNMKSYDIAVEVGFSPEYTYFSKVFKKVTGVNPNEYRRQVQFGTEGEQP